MANTEIMIRKEMKFKSNDLNKAVITFDKCFSGIQKNWRDACILMHRLEDGKKYTEDGFKSLWEFAESIGIEKSTAHHMADAGMVYDSKNPVIAEFADKAGYTKANKVASIVKSGNEKVLAEAIENGKVNPDMTVDKISEWKAEAIASTAPSKVLPKYVVDGVFGNGRPFHYDAIELEMIPELETCVKVGTFEKEVFNEDGKREVEAKWTVYANVYTGELIRIKFEKVKKESKSGKSKEEQERAKLRELAEKYGVKISFDLEDVQ